MGLFNRKKKAQQTAPKKSPMDYKAPKEVVADPTNAEVEAKLLDEMYVHPQSVSWNSSNVMGMGLNDLILDMFCSRILTNEKTTNAVPENERFDVLSKTYALGLVLMGYTANASILQELSQASAKQFMIMYDVSTDKKSEYALSRVMTIMQYEQKIIDGGMKTAARMFGMQNAYLEMLNINYRAAFKSVLMDTDIVMQWGACAHKWIMDKG